MKDYKRNLTQPVASLMVGLGRNTLPDIRINPNSELGILSGGVLTQGILRGPKDAYAATVELDLEKIGEYLDDDDNSLRVGLLESHAAAFAAAVENAHSVLKNDVGGLVEKMTDMIKEEFSRILRQEKAEDLLTDVVVSEADYTFLKWGDLRSAAFREAIVDDVNEMTGIKTGLQRSNLDIVFGKIERPGHSLIELPEEPRTNFLTAMKENFSTETVNIPDPRIERFVATMFNPQSYRKLLLETTRMFEDNRAIAKGIMYVINLSLDWQKMAKVAELLISKYTDSPTEAALKKNLTCLSNSMTMFKYACLVFKTTQFDGRLILPEGIINNEEYEKFVAQGFTIDRIHNYLKVLYRDRQVPLSGITTDMVTAGDIESRLSETIASIKLNEQRIKSESLNKAYDKVVRSFGKSFITDNLYNCGTRKDIAYNFIDKAIKGARFFKGNISTMQDYLYNTVLHCFYKGTLVETLYKYLGEESTALMKTQESLIVEDDILLAEMRSVIHPLAELLVNQLVQLEPTSIR